MKVLLPSKNKQTQGYSNSHKGYDHSGRGDVNYYSSIYGKVVISKNSETKNWLANKDTDPYKDDSRRPGLITEDYGNYIKIKGEVDGKTVYQLGAHFEPGSVLSQGTEVKAGQVVAKIGNTGNSTAKHCHTEYRDTDNKNFRVEFISEVEKPPMEELPKDSVIRDFYKASKETFSDDEVNRWLQENKNLYEIFTSVLEGDGAVREHLLGMWGIEVDTNKDKLVEQQRETILSIKDVLRRVGLESGQDSEAMVAKLEWLVDQYEELKDKQVPKVIYKYEDKDFSKIIKLWNLVLIMEGGDN